MIELDGSQGEGGGQILRTALSLSMCTGQAVHIVNIRAKRQKPGLMRQHLTAVQAAAQVCGAEVSGDAIGSLELWFAPGVVRGGSYQFNIGTAGSCTLVLQTLLPALLSADQDSVVELTGGTHNPMSPPFHFLERAFLPLLQRMGVNVDLSLLRYGFYPAGGGQLRVQIKAGQVLQPLHLQARGERIENYAEALFAGIPFHIAGRELAVLKKRLGWSDGQLLPKALERQQGPGNALLVTLVYEHVTEVFSAFGEKGVAAEKVADTLAKAVRRYLASSAVVGVYLADQLLLPMALAGGGSFTCTEWSQHAATNAEVIERFLPITICRRHLDEGVLVTLLPS
ncbi:RNA 3'-terminal phosphate cyclase [Methylosoma difficile]